MIIFIRGLPGTGKTTISSALSDKLDWRIINIDHYKNEFIDQNPNARLSKEFIPHSHKKFLEELSKIKKDDDLIVEELFWNKDFVKDILDLCKENNIQYQWFKLVRDEKILLSVKRKIRNTFKDFETMEKQINDIKIKGETIIHNQNINESVKQILNLTH